MAASKPMFPTSLGSSTLPWASPSRASPGRMALTFFAGLLAYRLADLAIQRALRASAVAAVGAVQRLWSRLLHCDLYRVAKEVLEPF